MSDPAKPPYFSIDFTQALDVLANLYHRATETLEEKEANLIRLQNRRNAFVSANLNEEIHIEETLVLLTLEEIGRLRHEINSYKLAIALVQREKLFLDGVAT